MPQILVEFVPDFTKLEGSLDALVKSGVLTQGFADAFREAQKPVDDLAKKLRDTSLASVESMKGMSDEAKKMAKSMVEDMLGGITDALKEEGVTLEEVAEKFKKGNKEQIDSSKTLRTEYLKTTQELAKMALEGKKNTEQYRELAKKAAEYKKALNDVQQGIRGMASETRTLDTVIASAQGVAAAFSVGAGAVQLFGDETGAFEESLLKLNAVMAISQGLQQIQQLTLKESAVIRAISNAQLSVGIFLEGKRTQAIIGSTAAMKLQNAVMKLSPVGILLTGIGLLAAAFALLGGKVAKAKNDIALFNIALEETERQSAKTQKALDEQGKIAIARLKQRGATQKEINEQEIGNMVRSADESERLALEQIELTGKRFDINAKSIDSQAKAEEGLLILQNALADKSHIKFTKTARLKAEAMVTALKGVVKNFQEQADKLSAVNVKVEDDKAAEAEKKRQDDDKAKDDAKRNAEQAKQKRKQAQEQAQQEFDDARQRAKKLIELRLSLAKEGSKEELDFKKQLIAQDLIIDIAAAKDNVAIITALRIKALKDINALEVADAEARNKKSLENEMLLIDAQLAAFNVSNEERLDLTTERLEKERSLELIGVEAKSIKEKEINARFDKEIRDAKFAINKEIFDNEIDLQLAIEHFQREQLKKISGDETLPASKRIAAEKELTDLTVAEIQKRLAFHKEQNIANNLSDKEFAQISLDLLNEESDAYASFEKKKTDFAKAGAEKRKEVFQKEFAQFVDTSLQVIGTIEKLSASFSAARNQRLTDELANITALREAHAITDREFLNRQKLIDEQKRKAAREDAKRQKAFALFSAVINGAAAIVKSLPPSPLFFITVALVAAEIAAIAAKPIPKFGKGTKRAPKGFAEVGETGTELIETDRGAMLTRGAQVVWLKGGERIYSPQETKLILPEMNPLIKYQPPDEKVAQGIDYSKLGKAIGSEIAKHPRNLISLDEDGFTTHVIEQSNKTVYKNKRYTFNA